MKSSGFVWGSLAAWVFGAGVLEWVHRHHPDRQGLPIVLLWDTAILVLTVALPWVLSGRGDIRRSLYVHRWGLRGVAWIGIGLLLSLRFGGEWKELLALLGYVAVYGTMMAMVHWAWERILGVDRGGAILAMGWGVLCCGSLWWGELLLTCLEGTGFSPAPWRALILDIHPWVGVSKWLGHSLLHEPYFYRMGYADYPVSMRGPGISLGIYGACAVGLFLIGLIGKWLRRNPIYSK
jgi:hypothetical protein